VTSFKGFTNPWPWCPMVSRLRPFSLAWGLVSGGVYFPRWSLTLAVTLFFVEVLEATQISVLSGMFPGNLLDALFMGEISIAL